MRSHVVFRVELGATLLGSRIFTDYPYEWQPGALVLDGTLTRRSPGSKHRQSLVAGARCVEETANGTDCAVWKKLVNVTIDGGGIIDGQGTYLLDITFFFFFFFNVTIDGGGIIDGQGAYFLDITFFFFFFFNLTLAFEPPQLTPLLHMTCWVGDLCHLTTTLGGVTGDAWWWACDAGSPSAQQRMDMVQIFLCDGLVIRDLTLRGSPVWTLHPTLCNDVVVDAMVIESGQFDDVPEYSGHNVDGCDPDSCTNVVISNSFVKAGDDCVAISTAFTARPGT